MAEIDRKELKVQAREALRQTRPHAIWVTLGITVALLIMQVLSLTLNGDLDAYKAMYASALEGQLRYVAASGSNSAIGWLLTMALDLMSLVLSVGYTLYLMRVSRRKGPSFGDVFDAFGIFFRAIWISVLRSVVISLWSFAYALPAVALGMVIDPMLASIVCLPLLAPMFMASYSYRLAVYIMLDEPAYSCIQCLALSRMAMQGRRLELFKLDLSFLGWVLLSIVPFVFLWVEPYMGVTNAGWYDCVMPGFREKLEKDLAEGRFSVSSRQPSQNRYHVPGEGDDGAQDDPDDKDQE